MRGDPRPSTALALFAFLALISSGREPAASAASDLLNSTYAPAVGKARYELEINRYTGLGTVMREERLYEVSPQGKSRVIQTRIYMDETGELREAAFLNRAGKWQYDTATSSKFVLDLVARADRATSRRIEVLRQDLGEPKVVWDQSLPPGKHVDPAVDFLDGSKASP